MADAGILAAPVAPSRARLIELLDGWRAELERLPDGDFGSAAALIGDALEESTEPEVYRLVGASLTAFVNESERISTAAQRLLGEYKAIEAAWRREWCYSEQGVEELRADLMARADRRADKAARRWLAQVLAAIEQADFAAVARVAAIQLPFPDELRTGADEVRSAAEAAAGGDREQLWGLIVTIARGQLPGWENQLDDDIRSMAHRIASWLSIDLHGDIAVAREHIDAAITISPYDVRAYVERSALHRIAAESDLALRDAQRVLELRSDAPEGLVALGACAEAVRDFDQADHFYDQALDRLPTWDLRTMRGEALIDRPSGRLLLRASERMLAAQRSRAALKLLEQALDGEISGSGTYPEADAYRLRADALETLDSIPEQEVALASIEAGRRYFWDGRMQDAITEHRRAVRYSDGSDESGWRLADALVSAQQVGLSPNRELTQEARETWTTWRQRYGPPRGDTSWAYLTRALIAEDSGDTDNDERWWDALSYVERALIEDDTEARRWVLRGRYMTNLALLKVAAEAFERAEARDPDLPELQWERLALLVMLDRLDDAERAALVLRERVGRHVGITMLRAYVAHRQQRNADALALAEELVHERPMANLYELLAVCQLAQRDVLKARESYRAVLDDQSEASPALRALAAFAVRGPRDDETDPGARYAEVPSELLGVKALTAYAWNESEHARKLLLEAVARASTLGELHQFEHDFRLHLGLLEDAELRAAAERVTDEVLTSAVTAKDAELRTPEITADRELDHAIAAADAARASGRDTAAPHVARAVKAHRLQDRGELDAAAEVYESLLSTPIDRIAKIALSRVLMRRRDELVEARNVERLEGVQARLLQLGAIGAIDRVLVTAPVLVQVGRPAEAQHQLRHALGTVSSTADDRERLLQAMGEAALVARDLQAAREAFEDVVTSARRENRHARVAQQYVRLAVVHLFSGRFAEGRRDISQAQAAWNEAGAFQAHWLLVQEVEQLARTVLPGIRSALMPLLTFAGVEEQALLEPGSDDGEPDASPADA